MRLVGIFIFLFLQYLLSIIPAYADTNQNWACTNNGDAAGAYHSISCKTRDCGFKTYNCAINEVCDDHYTETVTGQGLPCVPFNASTLNCTCKDSVNFTCGVNGSTNDFTRACGYGEICDNNVLSDPTKVWPCANAGSVSLSPSNVPTGYALNPCPNGICSTAIGDINVATPTGFIEKIFGILLSISGVIALILIIVSGYQLSLSQGNPEKVKNARERLTAAIIGLLFIIFSVAILQIIGVDILQLPGFNK